MTFVRSMAFLSTKSLLKYRTFCLHIQWQANKTVYWHNENQQLENHVSFTNIKFWIKDMRNGLIFLLKLLLSFQLLCSQVVKVRWQLETCCVLWGSESLCLAVQLGSYRFSVLQLLLLFLHLLQSCSILLSQHQELFCVLWRRSREACADVIHNKRIYCNSS